MGNIPQSTKNDSQDNGPKVRADRPKTEEGKIISSKNATNIFEDNLT